MEKGTKKNGGRNVVIELIVSNLILAAIGVLMIIYPDISSQILCMGIGIALALIGLICTIIYFARWKTVPFSSFSLVTGVVLLVLGIYFITRPAKLAELLSVIFAILLVCGCVFKIQYGLELLKLRRSLWWMELIGAAIMAVLSVIVFIDPFKAAGGFMIFVGVSLVFTSIWDVISVLFLASHLRKADQILNEAVEGYYEASADVIGAETAPASDEEEFVNTEK